MTCAHVLIILPCRSSRLQVPVCSVVIGHCTLHILHIFEYIFDSQKRFKKLKSFGFYLLLVMTVSDTFAK